MLELLYASGMRVSELLSLDTEDVSIESGAVRCFGKGGKERIVPIHSQATEAVRYYIEEVPCRPAGFQVHYRLIPQPQGNRLTRQGSG